MTRVVLEAWCLVACLPEPQRAQEQQGEGGVILELVPRAPTREGEAVARGPRSLANVGRLFR